MYPSQDPETNLNHVRTAHKTVRRVFRQLAKVTPVASNAELTLAFLFLFEEFYKVEQQLNAEYFTTKQLTLPNIEGSTSGEGDPS